MIRRQNRLFLAAAGAALFMLPLTTAALADDSGAAHEHNMYEDVENTDDFNATLEEQTQNVMQELDALKEQTKISREPLVKQEDAPYFNTTPDNPPVMEEQQPEPSYVYKKKSKQAAPSRSFNNVR